MWNSFTPWYFDTLLHFSFEQKLVDILEQAAGDGLVDYNIIDDVFATDGY